MSCPTHERVLDYLGRRLAPSEREAVETHVDICPTCRQLLGELARTPELDTLFETDPALDGPILTSLAGPDGERYELGDILGRGGMGEVRLARDLRVQREVAVKRMHAGQHLERFVHEARLQGGLEHPAIVPVHDVGIDADGMPYFVMKRLVGTTLEELFVRHPGAGARQQFLGKLIDVCLAIEFAHTRGIVHRDLKPANIMLGDFGEVYVLDWGVARVLAGHEATQYADPGDAGVVTRSGAIIGTPRYMSPEQARGEPVEARADVFALGCILFEILAGEKARGDEESPDPPAYRPSDRAAAADVAPELDDLCARATALDPMARPTARELAARLQGYLDRDRDLVRRRELASQHAELAERALTAGGDAGRATAMREAGRAIAVDPDSARAQALLARVLLAAPDQTPAAALAAADAERARTRQRILVRAAWGYLGLGVCIPLLLVAPTHNRAAILALTAMPIAMGLVIVIISRRPVPLRSHWYFVLLALNTLGLATGSLVFGPLLVMPVAIIASLACWLSLPTGYRAWITVVAHGLAIFPIVLLEALGVLPPTFAITGHSIVLTPPAFDITPVWTTVLLLFAFVGECANTIFFIVSSRRIDKVAQDRVHTHTWHLEQLLPKRSGSD